MNPNNTIVPTLTRQPLFSLLSICVSSKASVALTCGHSRHTIDSLVKMKVFTCTCTSPGVGTEWGRYVLPQLQDHRPEEGRL